MFCVCVCVFYVCAAASIPPSTHTHTHTHAVLLMIERSPTTHPLPPFPLPSPLLSAHCCPLPPPSFFCAPALEAGPPARFGGVARAVFRPHTTRAPPTAPSLFILCHGDIFVCCLAARACPMRMRARAHARTRTCLCVSSPVGSHTLADVCPFYHHNQIVVAQLSSSSSIKEPPRGGKNRARLFSFKEALSLAALAAAADIYISTTQIATQEKKSNTINN